MAMGIPKPNPPRLSEAEEKWLREQIKKRRAAKRALREPAKPGSLHPAGQDIWKDPRVVDALKDGRSAEDIMILDCPKCGRWGYYNEGSHFTCLHCDQDFYVLSEGERVRKGVPCVQADSAVTLSDTLDVGDLP